MNTQYVTAIKKEAKHNECFRKELVTGGKSQVVLMALQPAEEIGMEVHDGDQIIYIVEGDGLVVLDGHEQEVEKGSLIFVPAGIQHNLTNTGDEQLKLFTVYAPPQHAPGTVQATKKDADIAGRKETTYGFFERQMTLPKGIKESDVRAEFDNGVLDISMPRGVKPEELPKASEIPVKQAPKPIKV